MEQIIQVKSKLQRKDFSLHKVNKSIMQIPLKLILLYLYYRKFCYNIHVE